jgi:hypothetical protein
MGPVTGIAAFAPEGEARAAAAEPGSGGRPNHREHV